MGADRAGRPARGLPRGACLPRQLIGRQAWARLTEFQRRVYAVVRRIPKGRTRSYQWVAGQIGQPRAARAVGSALRRNPFAPAVPCHRVVRADGSLGGYAGGAAKKRALLRREGWRGRPAPTRVC